MIYNEFLEFKEWLLGDFNGYLNKCCTFKRVVDTMLISIEMCCSKSVSNLGRAKQTWDRLLLYIEAMKSEKDIQKREFTDIPYDVLLDSNVKNHLEVVLSEYCSKLTSVDYK